MPTAIGTCLGEESVLRFGDQKLENLPAFVKAEGAGNSPKRQKTVTKNHFTDRSFDTSSRCLKICMELLLTPKSRQNPHIQRLSL
ncbi:MULTISPECIES: hypothetical protein [Pseudomonas]|uniref:hypothetical protein n=1 Tax=Pseudomonas TaxID=286 RepID=UPI0012E35284|nr:MULTISPECIES: hypothetical protein [Pseudomonas]WHS55174.1 hypothetical protein QLH64_04175 [Pseudomonas brassicacearum]